MSLTGGLRNFWSSKEIQEIYKFERHSWELGNVLRHHPNYLTEVDLFVGIFGVCRGNIFKGISHVTGRPDSRIQVYFLDSLVASQISSISVHCLLNTGLSLMAQLVKRSPAMQETQVWSLSQEDLLEKELATHSNMLAWEIPWTEKPVGLQSMGVAKFGHDLVTKPPPPTGNRLFFELLIGWVCSALSHKLWETQRQKCPSWSVSV